MVKSTMGNPIYDQLSKNHDIYIIDTPSPDEVFRDYLRFVHRTVTLIFMISFAIVAQRMIHWIYTGEGLFNSKEIGQ